MNHFHRNIIDELNEWKDSFDRKPLILRGARQTGKTTIVDIFSKIFDQYIYLNLEKAEDREIFENHYPFDELVSAIYFLKNIRV